MLVTGTAEASPASSSFQFQGRGPGAYSFSQDSLGGSVEFWFARGSTHLSGTAPTAYNRVVFSHVTTTCDNGSNYPDGTNNCHQVSRQLDLFPAPDNTFKISANLSSAELPRTSAPLSTSSCDIDPDFNYTNCTYTTESVPVSASFTAVGALQNDPTHYQETEYCHNVYAGATKRRQATATFTVGDETFSTRTEDGGGFVNMSEGTGVTVSRC